MSDDAFAKVVADFCKGLEVDAPVASDGGYRGQAESPLRGEWLGGYSEARMLEGYSPMRVVFEGEHASAEDDLGKSEWTLVAKKAQELEWLKSYRVGERTYRGRKLPHAFVGAWSVPKDSRRVGCFWLVPADRLSTRHADKLRRGAKRRLWPAIGAQAVSLLFIAGSIFSIAILPWWLFPLPFVLMWLALKDALNVPGAAAEIVRALDELDDSPRPAEDFDEDERFEGDERVEERDFEEDDDDQDEELEEPFDEETSDANSA